jgi:hypothetical protein
MVGGFGFGGVKRQANRSLHPTVYSYCFFLLRQCILVAVTVACCFGSAEVIASATLHRMRQIDMTFRGSLYISLNDPTNKRLMVLTPIRDV